jgi:hypothetical protein
VGYAKLFLLKNGTGNDKEGKRKCRKTKRERENVERQRETLKRGTDIQTNRKV